MGGIAGQPAQRLQPGMEGSRGDGRLLPAQAAGQQTEQPRPHRQREHKIKQAVDEVLCDAEPAGDPSGNFRQIAVGGGQLAPRQREHRQREQHGSRSRRQTVFVQTAAQHLHKRLAAVRKMRPRQDEHPGQRVQKHQPAGAALRQHAAAGQHEPNGIQMPYEDLPVPQAAVLVAPQRHRHRQRHPAPRPQRGLFGGGAVQGAGGQVHPCEKRQRKHQHGPARKAVAEKDFLGVQVRQRPAGSRRPQKRPRKGCSSALGAGHALNVTLFHCQLLLMIRYPVRIPAGRRAGSPAPCTAPPAWKTAPP